MFLKSPKSLLFIKLRSSIFSFNVCSRGPKLCTGLALAESMSSSRTNEWQWVVRTQDLKSIIQVGGWSEEEYLLRHDKSSSNVYSRYHSDLPWNSSDRDVHHEHTRMRETQKYLRKSCYHHIECTVTTFLTAFMWRKSLNSIVLVTTTHRKPERVFDGQVLK